MVSSDACTTLLYWDSILSGVCTKGVCLLKLVPQGKHVYIVGRRIHHGFAGLVMFAAGIVLMLDDLKDFPWPLTRRKQSS